MKEALKVGDRVAIYGRKDGGMARGTGTVRTITALGLDINLDDGPFTADAWWHPSQCVRLIKRKRREWWISYTDDIGADWSGPSLKHGESVRVIEVKKARAKG